MSDYYVSFIAPCYNGLSGFVSGNAVYRARSFGVTLEDVSEWQKKIKEEMGLDRLPTILAWQKLADDPMKQTHEPVFRIS